MSMSNSTTIKIVNNGPNALVLRGMAGSIDLEVGATNADLGKFRAILEENPRAKALVTAQCTLHPEQEPGTIEETTPDLPTGPLLPIQHLTLSAAKRTIHKCKDVATLKRWRAIDARPEVHKMLHLRWRDLVPESEGGLGKVEVL